jgi:hypothetical protein
LDTNSTITVFAGIPDVEIFSDKIQRLVILDDLMGETVGGCIAVILKFI